MRNLKRALSLTLASVMLLGMMVVGSSALSFNDADDISNVTAATVLQELGVMVGDGNGNFMPDQPVTRAQMAILICRMLYGEKLNVSQFSGTTQYTDVPAYEYYNGYVNLATSLGIINGYGDGRFGPDDTVTTAQAALMLCRALGYFKGGEMTGNWGSDALAAIAQATKINMFGDLRLATNDLLSRDNVAEMVFNSMTKAVPVEYSERWGMYYTSSQSIMSGVEFLYTDTLGYTNFDLVYDKGEADDNGRPSTVWGLGRIAGGADSLDEKGNIPDSTATFRTEILKASNKTVATFTAKTGADDVAKALKGYKVYISGDDYRSIENTTTYSSSGKIDKASGVVTLHRTNGAPGVAVPFSSTNNTIAKAIAALTANGRLVEVFADDSNQVTDIITTSYTVAKVTGVSSNKDRTSYSFDVSALNGNDYVDEAVDDTIIISGSIAKDDIVTGVKIAGKVYIYPTTSFTGAQSSRNEGKDTVVIDGKTYDVAANMTKSGGTVATSDFANSDNDATYFVDQYGYLVRTDAIESTDFVVIDAIRWNDNSMSGYAQAKLIFADGTTQEVTLNTLNTGASNKDGFEYNDNPALADTSNNHKLETATEDNNTLFHGLIATYSVRDDGKYDLTLKNTAINSANVATGTAAKKVTTKGIPALQDDTNTYIAAISGNSKTVYIVKSKDGSDTKYNSYTGYQNVPSIEMGTGNQAKVSYVRDGNSGTLAKFIFIDATAGAEVGDTKGGDIVYVFDAADYSKTTDNDRFIYHNVVLNGELVDDLTADDTSTLTTGFHEVKRNDKGVVTSAVTVGTEKYVSYTVTASASDRVLNVKDGSNNARAFSYDGSEEVWVIDKEDKTVRVGNAEDAMKGETKTDTVWIKAKGDSGADQWTIEKMYVIKEDVVIPSSVNTFKTTPAPTASYALAAGTAVTGASVTVAVTNNSGAQTGTIAVTGTKGSALADADVITFTLAKDDAGSTITADNTGNVTVTNAGLVTIKYDNTNTRWGEAATAGSITITAADGTARTYTLTCTVSAN